MLVLIKNRFNANHIIVHKNVNKGLESMKLYSLWYLTVYGVIKHEILSFHLMNY